MKEEDIPRWEHTITARVKLRQRNAAESADVAWNLAKDDEESWYVVSIDWDNISNSGTERIK